MKIQKEVKDKVLFSKLIAGQVFWIVNDYGKVELWMKLSRLSESWSAPNKRAYKYTMVNLGTGELSAFTSDIEVHFIPDARIIY